MKQTRIDVINNTLTRLNENERNKYKNFVINDKEVEYKIVSILYFHTDVEIIF